MGVWGIFPSSWHSPHRACNNLHIHTLLASQSCLWYHTPYTSPTSVCVGGVSVSVCMWVGGCVCGWCECEGEGGCREYAKENSLLNSACIKLVATPSLLMLTVDH